MNHITYGSALAAVLFLGMFCIMELGRRIGERNLARDPDGAKVGVGVVEGAVFGLLGLLMAFTFSGAATRFDNRRQLVVEEANNIGTAWLRLDVLPHSSAEPLRGMFRDYLDSRIDVYRKLPDVSAAEAEYDRSMKLQAGIWQAAVAACRDSGTQPPHMLLLPALNQMIDITTTRTETMKLHPPMIIFTMLCMLSLIASLFAGYGMAGGRTRRWIHQLGFPLVMAATVYVISDIEYPRLGLIRIDGADKVLVHLRESMNEVAP